MSRPGVVDWHGAGVQLVFWLLCGGGFFVGAWLAVHVLAPELPDAGARAYGSG